MTIMMKGASLSTLSVPHKTALTGFLVLALIHIFAVSLGMALTHSGRSTQSIKEHYRGNQEDPAVTLENLKNEKTVTEVLLITHNHMAVMPMFTFLITHVLAIASTIGTRTKITLIIAAYLAIALEMSVPWFGLYMPSLVVLRHISRAGMIVTTLVGSAIPMYEMWWLRR